VKRDEDFDCITHFSFTIHRLGKINERGIGFIADPLGDSDFINGDNVDLDGKLDEPAWRLAKWESNFIQRNPK
jgi:hypothetical protein